MFGSMGQSAIKNLGNGGEMDGNVTITGDLEVQGGISLSVDEVIQGTSTIDVTNTEALLVRKNNDGGDIFVVDTTNSKVGIGLSASNVLQILHLEKDDADVAIAFTQSGQRSWHAGIDYSNSNRFSIGYSATVGANPVMTLTEDTRVGIGSDNPTVPLEVHDDEAEIAIFKRTTSAQSRIAIANSTKSAYLGLDGDEKFHIGFTQNLTNNTAFVIDDANNNIGIGTDSPTRQLTLAGAGSAILIDSSGHAYIELDRGGADDLAQLKFMTAGSAKWYAGMADSGSTGFDGTEFFIGEGSGGASDAHLVIDASGNIGIGRTPTQKLDIYASSGNQTIMNELGGAGNAELRLKNNAGDRIIRASSDKLQFIDNADSRVDLTINGSGNVGIGTTSPDAKLDIVGSDFAGASLKIERTGDGENDDSAIRLNRTGTVDANDRIGGIYFQDNDTSLALIRGEKIGTNDGRLDFIVPNGSALGNTTDPILTIQNDNVGIGTTTPSWGIETGNFRGSNSAPSFNGTGDGLAVDVYNGGNPYPRYISLGALGDSTATAQFDFYADAGSSMVKSLSIKHDAVIVNENSADVDFRVESDANTHAFFVEGSSGNVGIGSSSSKTNNVGSSARGITIANATTPVLSLWDTTNAGYHSHFYQVEGNSFIRSSGSLTIQTNGANTALTIDSSQRVGIGTATPTVGQLQINASIDTLLGLTKTSGATSGNLGVIRFGNTDVDSNLVNIVAYQDGATNAGALKFQTQATGSTTANVLTLGSDKSATFAGDIQANERITFTDTNNSIASNTLTRHSNGYLYIAGGSSGLVVGNSDTSVRTQYMGTSMQFETESAVRFKIDSNSRISLSNNDSGGTGGADSLSANTILGAYAGDNITTNGVRNTKVGHASGNRLTTGTDNTSFGHYSGFHNKTGDNNTFIGSGSGQGASNQSHSNNTAVGFDTLKLITDGVGNTVMGSTAGDAITTQSNCTLIGQFAGSGINSADANGSTAVGNTALWKNTSGRYNTAIGFQSLAQNLTGDSSTSLGYQALTATLANDNTGIGYLAGDTITSGTGNTIIGASADVNLASATNRTSIGQGTVATEDNSIFIGNSSAHTLYIGKGRTTTQNIRFNDASEAGMIQYDHSNGMFRMTVEGTEHSRFASGGDLVLLHGGVNFLDAEGTSASSDANTLDDYEEGVFTPTITTNSTDFTSVTYDSLVKGKYTKIGNIVHVQGFLRTDAINKGSASGDVAIGGLPFTAGASTSGTANGHAVISISNATGWTGENPSHGIVIAGGTIIQLYYADYNVDPNNVAVSDVTDGTSANKNALYFAGTYTV